MSIPRSIPEFENAQGSVTKEAPINEFQTLNIIVNDPCVFPWTKP